APMRLSSRHRSSTSPLGYNQPTSAQFGVSTKHSATSSSQARHSPTTFPAAVPSQNVAPLLAFITGSNTTFAAGLYLRTCRMMAAAEDIDAVIPILTHSKPADSKHTSICSSTSASAIHPTRL